MSLSLTALWSFLFLSLYFSLRASFCLWCCTDFLFLRSVFTLAYRAHQGNDLSSQLYCQNLEYIRLSIYMCWVLFITEWLKGSSHLSLVSFYNLLLWPVCDSEDYKPVPRNPREGQPPLLTGLPVPCFSTLQISGHLQHFAEAFLLLLAFLRTWPRFLSPSTKCYWGICQLVCLFPLP